MGPAFWQPPKALFTRNPNRPGVSKASLDGGDLAGSYICGYLDLTVKCPIVASAVLVRGIAARWPGAGGVLIGRRLDEDVRPRNTMVLHKVFDR
jgi:hypothetical protein